MPTASRVGTIDPMGKTRVYVDETLREVPAGSTDAAYVYKRGDLERLRDRRTELGLAKGDEALRVMIASRKIEVSSVERRMSALKAELAALTEEVEAAEKAEKKASAKTAKADEAKTDDKVDAKAKDAA